MRYYCHLDSPSGVDKTNLQLYSLQQAADSWNEVIDGMADPTMEHRTERLTFILSSLGLSLSQLLGQNSPSSKTGKTRKPGDLLSAFLKSACVDRTTRGRLNATFKSFLSYYGAVRHFGRIEGNAHYRKIGELTLDKLDVFCQMTIEIWDMAIKRYRIDKENEFDEFKSISEVVLFRGRDGGSH